MKKIYDSTETLKAGLKAEQATVVEYTEYLNLAKANNNESEAKLWEHIIADEKEHIKELEDALKGNFELHDDDVIIREKTPEQIAKHEEIVEDFTSRLFDVLADANIDPNKYGIREEDPYYYVDFADEEGECLRGYEALNESLFKCDFVDDDGFYYVRVLSR